MIMCTLCGESPDPRYLMYREQVACCDCGALALSRDRMWTFTFKRRAYVGDARITLYPGGKVQMSSDTPGRWTVYEKNDDGLEGAVWAVFDRLIVEAVLVS